MAASLRSAMLLPLLAAVLMLLASRGAMAHGGGLHRWSFRQDVLEYVPTAAIRNDVNERIATCGNFTALNLTALTPASFTLPWFPASNNFTLDGTIDVYSYLSNNCTNSINAGLFPLLRLSRSIPQGGEWISRPVGSGISASGYGFEGSCSAPGNLYRNNATLQDNRFNLAFWGYEHEVGIGMNTSDRYPGVLWGSAPQSWFFRNSTAANRMRSIIVFTQGGPTFCCNVQYFVNATDAVLSQGKTCTTSGGHRKLAGAASNVANVATAKAARLGRLI